MGKVETFDGQTEKSLVTLTTPEQTLIPAAFLALSQNLAA